MFWTVSQAQEAVMRVLYMRQGFLEPDRVVTPDERERALAAFAFLMAELERSLS
jgi:hypothetical protein